MTNAPEITLEDVMDESASEYAQDVILQRAIPDLRDGLKPVHRKVMWQAELNKLHSTSAPMSLATVVGSTMKWHPHGDGSIEDAAKKMARDWISATPLLAIIGQGGSIDAEPAKMRYLKVQKTRTADLMTRYLDKNAVDMQLNYDGTAEEPTVLPAAVPAALILGTQGIAWGMKTDILPHNPIEMLDLCLLLLNSPDADTDEIMRAMPGPDFPTGGTIIGRDSSRAEIETGHASFKMRGSMRNVTSDDGFKAIEIYELLHNQSSTAMIDQLNDVLSPVMTNFNIARIDNDTRRSEPSIKIVFTKRATDNDLDMVQALIYKKTQLEKSFTANNRMVHDGWTRVYNVRDYIKEFLDFRRETLKRITEFELDSDKKDLEIVVASLFMIDHAQEIVEIASLAESREALVQNLSNQWESLTERQSDFISKQPVYRMSKKNTDWIDDLKKKERKLNDSIGEHERILGSADALTEHLRKDLESSIEFLGRDNYPRKTQIIDEEAIQDADVKLDVTATIDSKPVMVIAKNDLSVCRIGVTAYGNQEEANEGSIAASHEMKTDEFVMFVTKKGRIVTRLVNDLPHTNLNEQTEPLNRSVDSLESDDEFIGVVPVRDSVRVLTISKHGYVKVSDATKLAPSTTTRGYIKKTAPASGLKIDGDELILCIVFEKGELQDTSIEYDVELKTTDRHESMALNKWLERNDSGGSSGARGLKVRDGELTPKNMYLANASGETITKLYPR